MAPAGQRNWITAPPSAARWLYGRGAVVSACRTSQFVAAALLLLGVLILPWQLGGYSFASQQLLSRLLMFSAAVAMLGFLASGHGSNRITSGIIALVGLIFLGLLQQLPLGRSVVAAFSPQSAAIRASAAPFAATPTVTSAPDVSEGRRAGEDWSTISLAPEETRQAVVLLVLGTAIFYLASILFRSPRSQVYLCVAVTLQGLLLGLWGLFQVASRPDELLPGIAAPSRGAIFSAWVNHATAAGYLNMCLAAAVGLAIRTLQSTLATHSREPLRDRFRRAASPLLVGQMIAITAIMSAIIAAQSRGALVALVIAAVVLVVVLSGARSIGYSMATAILAAGLLLLPFWLWAETAASGRYSMLVDGASLRDGRLDHWKDSLATMPHYLRIGSGFGTYGFAYLPYQQGTTWLWFDHAHNEYFETLVEAGIPGLVGLLWVLAAVTGATVAVLCSARLAVQHWFACTALIVLVTQVVQALTDFGLHMPSNFALAALLCGAICGTATLAGDESWWSLTVPWPASGSLPIWGIAVCFLTLAVSAGPLQRWAASEAVWRQNRELLDSRVGSSLQRTAEAFDTGPLDQAIARSRVAIHDAPNDLELRLQMILLLEERYALETSAQTAKVLGVEPGLGILELTEASSGRERARAAQQARQQHELIRRLVSPIGLHRQLHAVEGQEREELRNRLRSVPAIRDNLLPALEHLEAARSLCPLVPEVHYRLGLYGPLCDVDDQPHLATAAKLWVADPVAQFRIGLLHLNSGRTKELGDLWTRSLELSRDRLDAILTLARRELDEETIVRDLLPADAELLVDLVDPLGHTSLADPEVWRTGSWVRLCVSRAEELAKLIAAEDPASYASLMGRIKIAVGEHSEAAEHLRPAVRQRPNDPDLRYRYAFVLYQLGDYQESQRQIQWCIRLKPRNQEFKRLLADIRQAESDTSRE